MDIRLIASVDEIVAILTRLGLTATQGRQLMATIDTVEGLITELKANTDLVATKLDLQTAEIAKLKTQVSAGTPVSQEQLDALSANLQPITDHLKAMGADPTNPIPLPPAAPPTPVVA